MIVSMKGVVSGVIADIKATGKMSDSAMVQAMNRVSGSHVETPAVESVSEKKQVSKGVVRWHHDVNGARTKRRRLIKKKANKKEMWVGWRWGTKSGEPGKVSVISLPGRKQTKAGVKAGRSGRLISGAFIQVSKRGQPGAYVRRTKARYPIQFLRIDLTGVADAAFNKRVKTSGGPVRDEYDRLLKVKFKKSAARSRRRAGRVAAESVKGALR